MEISQERWTQTREGIQQNKKSPYLKRRRSKGSQSNARFNYDREHKWFERLSQPL